MLRRRDIAEHPEHPEQQCFQREIKKKLNEFNDMNSVTPK